MTPKLVIFDFDGTLADTLPFTFSIMDELADKFGTRRLDKQDLPKLRGYNPARIIQMYDIPLWKIPLMTRESQLLLHRNIDNIRLFPGIERVIHTLSAQGINMAVVSSNALQNVKQVLGEEITRLIHYFECQTGLFGKAPHLRKALRQAGIKPEEALCIGDEIRDIEAARQVGIPCAAVTWGFAEGSALAGYQPDHLVDEVHQIIDIINSR